jgi:hypothetical protein
MADCPLLLCDTGGIEEHNPEPDMPEWPPSHSASNEMVISQSFGCEHTAAKSSLDVAVSVVNEHGSAQ